jgi:hypothetical protein
MSFMTKINNEENFVKNKIRNLLLKLPANSEWFNFENLKKFESDFFVVITTPRHPLTKNHIENIGDFSRNEKCDFIYSPGKRRKNR